MKSDPLVLLQAGFSKTLTLYLIDIGIVSGVTQGAMGLKVAGLLKEVGKIKESEELLQAIIQFLEKVLTNMNAGMDSTMGAYKIYV